MRRTIPTYALYGELLSGSYSDPVHHETIHERSSKHDWTIRLHRHSQLIQIFLFQSPGVSLRLGAVDHTSAGPMILVVPPGVAHGFRFPDDILGDVLSLPPGAPDQDLRARLVQAAQGSGGILTPDTTADFAAIAALMGQMGHVFHTMRADRAALLEGIAHLMAVYLVSAMRGQLTTAGPLGDVPLTHHERQAQDFCARVEARFASADSVTDYAAALGVSAPHLTRVCNRILGVTPNEVLRQRRLVEAKRLLEYTRLAVSDIAHRAGFRDPAFFSRTFKASLGQTPQAYRAAQD